LFLQMYLSFTYLPIPPFTLISSFYFYHHHLILHSFPTRRSSDLTKSIAFSNISSFNSCTRVLASPWDWNTSPQARYLFPSCFIRSEEHTSELQSRFDLVCRHLLDKKKYNR